ncbi:dynamin family protein [Thermocoleostomius sinensis]|uniref:Dynamin family protein n=1 Tax=Thermocoleostomius sinensis A174 TaxID=2016057 RepID=A0A9E8ZDM5_9CYAN|nr:dynamin family protein [Thermocoleostomius sinensis]WAL59453.1 dynamin family protein [Thermocoleostomius sinensis A174]
MSSQIVDEVLQDYRFKLNDLLHHIERLSSDINNAALEETVESLRRNINEPFLFVVVGEVKAGKSSFINALLGAEVCETDIEPRTDAIQQIVYADEPFRMQIEPNLRKIGLPIDILKDISIVDTPGTNTIIQEHQIITERYIPNSDLTFFVLFGKNPYQKSAWDFLDFVSVEWRKKVVFILQQADLLKPADLQTNLERVRDYANLKQIKSPIIFATSADRELNNEAESGFEAVRAYIRNMVSSGESYKIKLRSVSGTTQKIIDALSGDIRGLQEQLEADRRTVDSIRSRIEAGRKRSRYEVDNLTERLVGRYDSLSARIKREFRDSLSVFTVIRRSFVGIFNKEASMQAWVNEFQERCQRELKSSLEEVSNEGAQHFVDGIRQLLEGLTHDLNNVQTKQIQSNLISIKILERRQEVIESVKCKVNQLFADEDITQSLSANADNMAAEIVGGAIASVAGIILHIIEFTVAEAILNAIGIAFAGIGVIIFAVGIAWQRNRIIQRFEQALDNEKDRFKLEITDRLNQKLSIIYEEVERIFVQFYDYVEHETEEIAPIIDRYKTIQANAEQLFSQMNTRLS